jgi:hypothetical protein
MADIALQDFSLSGAAASYSAAAGGGDSFAYDPAGVIHCKNGGGGSITMTVVVPGATYGQNNPDIAVSVPNGGDRFVKMAAGMVNPATGKIDVTYSGVTSVTVAALRAPAA